MGLKVNGIAYESWDAVPAELRIAIAASGTDAAGSSESDEPVEEEDELDRLVRLAEERERGVTAPTPPPPATDCPTFELNGQTYTSLDQVPGEIRGALRLELTGPPQRTVEARVPKALIGSAQPSAPGQPGKAASGSAPRAGISGDRAGAAAPDDEFERPPMLPMRTKVAIGVMLLITAAMFIAIRMVG